MAGTEGISTVLKRRLKTGKEYDKLIPSVKCDTTSLGSGDTFFTVDAMQGWIEKYAFQTAKLAPKLKGRGLEETVKNIYNFLYSHIQYEADGALQQLRSPACTWMQRKSGVDCKSYSVFASALLSNLGIKHFIRQVRQPNFYPNEFTHVYVVVPKNQSDKELSNSAMFVLDATKHENVETNFIEKVDLRMTKLKHIGLNAPQDERTQRIVKNFNRFSNHLLEVGVPAQIVKGIRERVSSFTSRGVDPQFKVVDKGISIQGVVFPLDFTSDGEYQRGLGIEPITMATAGAIMELLPADFLGNTFGSIFANGFDLSCWNASYSESKATQALEVDVPFFLTKYSGFSKNPNTTTFNKFLNGISGYIADSINGQNSKYAECTRKGYALRQKGAEGAREQIIGSLKAAGFKLIPTGSAEGHIAPTTLPSMPNTSYQWGSKYGAKYAYRYDTYRLEGGSGSIPVPTSPKTTGGSTPTPTPTGGNNYQDQGMENIQQPDPTAEKSNTGLIIGGVALASLPLLFMMKKGSVAANTPAKKKTTKK